jgi:hypothetical protein
LFYPPAEAPTLTDLIAPLIAAPMMWPSLPGEKSRKLRLLTSVHMRLLIERIDYDGGTGSLDIAWRLAGFGQLAEEIGS